MIIHLNKTIFIIFLLMQIPLSQADIYSRWNQESKNKYIQECSSNAIDKALPLYSTAFQGKMSTAEYNAFIQSINQQMTDNCHCIITEASKAFSHRDFINKPDSVTELASSLTQTGAACSPNMDDMVNQMKNLMGISN